MVFHSLQFPLTIPYAVLLVLSCLPYATAQTTVSPQSMKVVGEVDQRYVSYNVEAVEVTGGRFWAPYKAAAAKAPAPPATQTGNQPAGLDSSLFQYRSPIDLSNPKLRKLASALGPSFVRVSGTWRNATWFQDNDEPPMKTPPDGFNAVLTRAEWKGVVEFAKAVNAEIVTSVAVSQGVRDASGEWTPKEAKPWLDYTLRIGGRIAAIEFMNEPTLLSLGNAPKGYDASAYGRDAKIFDAFLRRESPGTLHLGPGSTAEGVSSPSLPGGRRFEIVSTDDLMKATGPIFGAFSYHFYSTPSHRCLGEHGADPNKVLSAEWFDRDLTVYNFYAKERDTYMKGKNIWLTETGEAACGGDTWAAQFADSFRLLDQFGSLARRSVKSIMYNTLASSDYGLLDEETLNPRPNYWAALLWKRTMGTRALDPGVAPAEHVRVYAQCMQGAKGGVTLLVLNMDEANEASLKLPVAAERYTLTSTGLFSSTVLLNGRELRAGADGAIPSIRGEANQPGEIKVAARSITFLTMSKAGNRECAQ